MGHRKAKKEEGNLIKKNQPVLKERVNHEPTSLPELKEGQPWVMRSPPAFPVVIQHMLMVWKKVLMSRMVSYRNDRSKTF